MQHLIGASCNCWVNGGESTLIKLQQGAESKYVISINSTGQTVLCK